MGPMWVSAGRRGGWPCSGPPPRARRVAADGACACTLICPRARVCPPSLLPPCPLPPPQDYDEAFGECCGYPIGARVKPRSNPGQTPVEPRASVVQGFESRCCRPAPLQPGPRLNLQRRAGPGRRRAGRPAPPSPRAPLPSPRAHCLPSSPAAPQRPPRRARPPPLPRPPPEGWKQDGASNGTSGGSAISPEGWRFNICNDPGRRAARAGWGLASACTPVQRRRGRRRGRAVRAALPPGCLSHPDTLHSLSQVQGGALGRH
jgi:hypothetical protein